MMAPVGLGTVEVGEAVFSCQGSGTENVASLLYYVGIGGEGYDGPFWFLEFFRSLFVPYFFQLSSLTAK